MISKDKVDSFCQSTTSLIEEMVAATGDRLSDVDNTQMQRIRAVASALLSLASGASTQPLQPFEPESPPPSAQQQMEEAVQQRQQVTPPPNKPPEPDQSGNLPG